MSVRDGRKTVTTETVCINVGILIRREGKVMSLRVLASFVEIKVEKIVFVIFSECVFDEPIIK